jgi:RHS repeat-associated protein
MNLYEKTTHPWRGLILPSKGGFRKACRGRFRSHLLASQAPRRNSRTCLEGPFGELLRATGPLAKANPIRFSTKYQDDETDLVYYGYRYYNSGTGRWISRDPIEEQGGEDLYEFDLNQPVNEVDPLGEKILSLEIRHSGAAEIPDSTYTSLVYNYASYFEHIFSGELGFKKPFFVKAFDEYTVGDLGRIFKVERPARTVVGFKFEYVVKRECPRDRFEKNFELTQTISDFQLIGRKNGKGPWQRVRLNEWKGAGTPDGPRLIEYYVDKKQIVGGDMLRDIMDKGDKYEYKFSVTWKVKAKDNENAWEGVHRINLQYSSTTGSAKAFILQAPREVTK